jgi:hypothetical protein
MATYGKEEILAVVNGFRTTTGTLYTCPANRYARASVRVKQTSGVVEATIEGANVTDGSSSGSKEVFLNAGQTIEATIATGIISYTALEFSKP